MSIPPVAGVVVDALLGWRASFQYMSASVQAEVVVEVEVHLGRLVAPFPFAEVVAEVVETFPLAEVVAGAVEMVPLNWKS